MIGVAPSPFTGALAGFADTLRWAEEDAGETQAAPDLRPHLDCFHASAGGPWPASCSLWGQVYFNMLLIPATCLLASGWPGDAVARRVAPTFRPSAGTPLRFTIYGERGGEPSAQSSLTKLLDAHVGRVIETLAAHGHLSRRMLWEGANQTLSWTVAQLAADRPDRIPQLERLAHPGSRLVFTSAPSRQPARKFCCLRYQLAGHQTCAEICPLGKTSRAKA